MTNKIEINLIHLPFYVKYVSKPKPIVLVTLAKRNTGGIVFSRGISLTFSQAKELSEILPEFIKKIEEEK